MRETGGRQCGWMAHQPYLVACGFGGWAMLFVVDVPLGRATLHLRTNYATVGAKWETNTIGAKCVSTLDLAFVQKNIDCANFPSPVTVTWV